MLIFGTVCYQFLRSTDFKIALLGVPVFRKWNNHISVCVCVCVRARARARARACMCVRACACVYRNFVLIFSVCFFLVPLFSGLKHVETMLMYFHVCILCNDIWYDRPVILSAQQVFTCFWWQVWNKLVFTKSGMLVTHVTVNSSTQFFLFSSVSVCMRDLWTYVRFNAV